MHKLLFVTWGSWCPSSVPTLHTVLVILLGREWAATTTEGLLVYSLDKNLFFDPFDLDMDITPDNVKKTLKDKEYTTALMLAFRLNEQNLIEEVVENIPPENGM